MIRARGITRASLLAALLAALLLAQIASMRPTTRLAADARDIPLLSSGLHAREDDAGRVFRWTTGDTRLTLPTPRGGARILTLWLGRPAYRRASADYPD